MDLPNPTQALSGLNGVLAQLTAVERTRVEQAAKAAEGLATAAARAWEFDAPAKAADAALAEPEGPSLDRLRRGLAALWALELPRRVAALNLPASVTQLYPDATARLEAFLAQADEPYDLDYWAKDVRLVLGLTVPCKGQVVDLYARLAAGELLRHMQSGRGLGPALGFVAARGWGPWLQIHTESRHLEFFNAAGWDACYVRVADILRGRPALRGLIGSSWFYDPPLGEISPRLSYLRERQTQNGAFMVHQGTGEVYTARCVQTSASRRKLVEDGAYTPRSWTIFWPRKALIAWADTQPKV